MHITDIFQRDRTTFSFEFFPPNTPEGQKKLRETTRQLAQLKPEFFSVTYGAGGSTRERTHATISRILRETTLKPAAHLTCVASTKAEMMSRTRSFLRSRPMQFLLPPRLAPTFNNPSQQLDYLRFSDDALSR